MQPKERLTDERIRQDLLHFCYPWRLIIIGAAVLTIAGLSTWMVVLLPSVLLIVYAVGMSGLMLTVFAYEAYQVWLWRSLGRRGGYHVVVDKTISGNAGYEAYADDAFQRVRLNFAGFGVYYAPRKSYKLHTAYSTAGEGVDQYVPSGTEFYIVTANYKKALLAYNCTYYEYVKQREEVYGGHIAIVSGIVYDCYSRQGVG